MDAVAGLAPGSGLIAAAAQLWGCPAPAFIVRQAFRRQPLAAVRPRPTPMRALVAKERQVVLDLLREPRFVIWLQPKSTPACSTRASICARSAPCIASSPSMTKFRERRRQLRRPVYQKPELLAEGPNQVWSWDITKLMGREMELFLSLCHHRYFQPQDRRLVHRRC